MQNSALNIIIPENFCYSCLPNCAVCCKADWSIDIDEETYKNLSKVEWEKISKKFACKKKFIEKNHKKYFELIEGKCIFLDDDKYCLIHKKMGFDAKSSTCKIYPLKFIKTADGIIVRLSFVCPSIIKNTGVPLEEQIAEIEKIAALKPEQMRQINEIVAVNEDIKVSWTDYKKLENFILDLLKTGDNYESSLKASAKFLRIVIEGLQKKEEISGILEKIDKKILFVRMDAFGGKKENNDIFSKKQRLYYALFVGYEFVGRADASAFKKYSNLVKLIFKKGTLELKGRKFDVSRVYKTYFNIDNKENMKLIKKYIEHLIFTKWHLLPADFSTPNVISGYSLILVIYALVKWFSRAFAVLRGSSIVELCDVENAVSIVDLNYAGHITRETLFLNSPVFSKICNLLISQNNFEEIII
ncbi:MAG: flagellin lysine-N-methylase [Elusimicrobiota bacterium]